MSQRAHHASQAAIGAPSDAEEHAPGEPREDLQAILADWRRRLRKARDSRPRDGARGARERALASALLDAARAQEGTPEDEESLRKLAMIAALYGAEQRERMDPGALCEELGHLGQSVWHHLRHLRLDPEAATRRILALDRALSVALRAALSSGFRCAPEQVAALAPVTSVTTERQS